MVIVANDDPVGFYAYVTRRPQRADTSAASFRRNRGPADCRHCDRSPAGEPLISFRSGLVSVRGGGPHRTPLAEGGSPVNPLGLTLPRIPTVAAGNKRLHVAMIAPPYFDVPPTAYGGVEAVVADLVDALIDRDHQVTLIGGGRHRTRAQRFLATYQRQPADHLGEPLPEVVHAAQVA